MNDPHAFEHLLRRLRKARDLTQEALAQRASCALDTIKKIEAGRRRPSRHLAMLFADVLELDAAERAAFLTAARATLGAHLAATSPSAPEAPSARRTNLPIDPLPFIGRAAELASLDTLLSNPSVQVITIVGPGGMGKTRLAIEAARRQLACARFPDGVFFVSLAALDDPSLMATPIADALGFSFYLRDQREHWTRDKQAAQLAAFLHNKQLLLVLDNLEHLLADLSLITSIIGAAPGVTMLITSREPLNVRLETVVPLQGLTLLPGDTGTAQADAHWGDAGTLFVIAARRAHPELALSAADVDAIATICRCVDGMPLGVELAATWAGVLSPAVIATEIQANLDMLASTMRDLPERQRSIRAVFDAAWANLSEAERAGIMQIVVFHDGFTRAAAQQVAGTTLTVLRALVQKSLVRADATGHYHVHELLRQFAAERLAKLPELSVAVQERHCAYYVALLTHHQAGLASSGEALDTIEADRYNVATAWKWAAAQGKLDSLELAMENLCEFHRIRGDQEVGSALFHIGVSALGWAEPSDDAEALPFEETLDLLSHPMDGAAASDGRRLILGRLLVRWGRFHCESPHADAYTIQVRDAAIRHLSATGFDHELAYLVRYLGHLGYNAGESNALYRWALQTFEEHGDALGMAEIRFRLGVNMTQSGAYHEAERIFQDSLIILRGSGRVTTYANCLGDLGYVYWALGNYQQAEQYSTESYAIATSIGYRASMAFAKRLMARVALARHDCPTARQHLRESLATYAAIGLLGMQAETLAEYSQVCLLDGALTEAAQSAQQSLALCDARSYRAGRAEPLIVLGQVACAQHDWRAARGALREALEVTRDAQLPAYALHALAGVVQLCVAVNNPRRAQELAGFIRQHPATWQWIREQLATYAGGMESEVQWHRSVGEQTARRHDRHDDLWKHIAVVIAELRRGDGCDAAAMGD